MITCLVQVADFFVLLLAGEVALGVLPGERLFPWSGSIFLASFAASLVTLWVLTKGRRYGVSALRSVVRQFQSFAGAGLLGAGSSMVCLFLMRSQIAHVRLWPFLWLGVAGSMFGLSRLLVARLMARWTESGQLARRVAVVGTGPYSQKFIERLREEPLAYTFVGLYDDRRASRMETIDREEIRGSVAELMARSREEQIDVIAVALPLEAMERIQKILDQLRSAVSDVCLTTGLAGLHYTSGEVSAVGTNPVILISEHPFKDWRAVSKLAFDVSLAAVLLILLSPVLATVAAAIWLDSSGPVLFRQPRRGFNNKLFACYKFRTMRVETEDLLGDRQTTRNDVRVTRVGRLLRRSSLDELPQLLNVLRGEMSLVGPRPHAPNTKAADQLFEDVVSQYATRHRVKPGITGWAQVNGWRGETRTVEQIEQRVACDLSYIERWSLLFDVKILVMTLYRGLFAANAF